MIRFSFRIAAILITVQAATGSIAQAQSSQAPASTATTVVHVSVVARDRYVDDLKESNFVGAADGAAARHQLLGLDGSTSVVVVLDTSYSMERLRHVETLRAIADGLAELDNVRKESREYALVAAAESATVVSDFVATPAKILSHDLVLPIQRRTAIHDACAKAAAMLRDRPTTKHVLILISDGEDNMSKISMPNLRRLLIEQGVVFYGVYLRRPQSVRDDGTDLYGLDRMQDYAKNTGGFVTTTSDLAGLVAALHNVGVDLRNQYSLQLSFLPEGPEHETKLDVRIQNLDGPRQKLKLTLRFRRIYRPVTASDLKE